MTNETRAHTDGDIEWNAVIGFHGIVDALKWILSHH